MPHSQADMREYHGAYIRTAQVWLCTSWLSANHILINQAMKVFQT